MITWYIFLAIALFCGITEEYCGKRSSGTPTYLSDALLINNEKTLMMNEFLS